MGLMLSLKDGAGFVMIVGPPGTRAFVRSYFGYTYTQVESVLKYSVYELTSPTDEVQGLRWDSEHRTTDPSTDLAPAEVRGQNLMPSADGVWRIPDTFTHHEEA